MADPTFLEMARAFHVKYGLPVSNTPGVISPGEASFRHTILEEEVNELWSSCCDEDIVGIADALADITYVVCGTAVVYGIPLDEVFKEVHRSNMTKTAPLNGVGKVLKGSDYSPPDIAKVLELHERTN